VSRPERRVALVGAFLGAFASAYLLVDYVFGSGICLTGSGCDIVRGSAFAYPLGVPLPLVGLVFYLVAAALLMAGPAHAILGARVDALAAGLSLAGLVAMAILTGIEVFVIGALCSWCLLSSLASVLLAGGAVFAWRHPEPDMPRPRSARARRDRHTEVERSRRELRRFAGATAGLLGLALVALLALPALTSGTPVGTASVDATDRPSIGAGPVEVVVFSDFQCPACAVAAPALSRLAGGDEISLTYRYFPLVSIHPNAEAAAEAAHAAAMQDRFWPFHDVLFARQASWADLSPAEAATAFEVIAAEVGLDVERWRSDRASVPVSEAVAGDARDAQELRLSGTPTIFIEGVRYDGPLSDAAILDAVTRGSSPSG